MKRILTALLITGFLGYGILFYAVPLFFPLPAELEAGPPRGLLFTDREDRPVRRMLDGDLRADEPATFEEFPTSLIEATLAAEDSRFFSHNGIDFIGICRALKDSASAKEFVSGASTITQQTIKLYSPRRKRDLKTKVIEAFTARKLEMFADKETILTAYLNKL
ncbi:MAG: transglycosylase domain-containing protein, partial [Verrucomicrobiales bacterium]|nr:transglycosylase domain-containing protein [Verrucomicrobiales bacterium]